MRQILVVQALHRMAAPIVARSTKSPVECLDNLRTYSWGDTLITWREIVASGTEWFVLVYWNPLNFPPLTLRPFRELDRYHDIFFSGTARLGELIQKKRPDNLPDFEKPPIVEAVLGVQFQPISGFTTVHLADIWRLFSSDFPNTEEQNGLMPKFETFGDKRKSGLEIIISSDAPDKRYWFLSTDKNEILQFQGDRFLHNWRKTYDSAGGANKYPRFESIADSFERELTILEQYFQKIFGAELLRITQCELTYVNHFIQAEDSPELWLKFQTVPILALESLVSQITKIISDDEGPSARLYASSKTVFGRKGEKIIRFELTVRGLPRRQNIESAIKFLYDCREVIVREFTDSTTEQAHKYWKRTK